jgi:GTP cyclohydrolase II
MGMYSGHFSVVFLSPVPQFAAIGYKFDQDKCIIIELYLKSGNIKKIRRILNSDDKLTKLAKDVWISEMERIELKDQVGPAGKTLYLECTKL